MISKPSVGLLVIATNKYTRFIQGLVTSADRYFLPGYDVTTIVFTDKDVEVGSSRKVEILDTEHKTWPYVALGKFGIYHKYRGFLRKFDYLFNVDVDCLFVGPVGSGIFSRRTALSTQYGIITETRPESSAYLKVGTLKDYYAGGFHGGEAKAFLEMAAVLKRNTEADIKRGIIGVWHDEAYLNHYMYHNPPEKALDKSFYWPEHRGTPPPETKLLTLEKDLDWIRSEKP